MPVTVETVQQIVHPNSLGGNQGEAKIVTFADGSFVVAWQSTGLTLTTFLQRFTADGVASGSVVEVGAIGGLRDIVATNDGLFAVVGSSDTSLAIRTFNPATMTQVASQSLGFSTEITGAQLVAQAGGTFGVMVTLLSSVRAFGVVNTSGQIVTGFVTGGTASGGVIESVAGGTSGVVFSLENGVLSSSLGGALAVPGFAALDLLRISDGFYVIAQTTTSNQVFLTGLSQDGQINNIGSYGFSSTVQGSAITGTSGTGQTVTAAELVDLGGGRILSVFASFRGVPTTGSSFATSGIHAQVYNLNSGTVEGSPVLIQSIFNLFELQQVRLQGSVMADGRVAVAITRAQGLTGLDVFRTVLDPRDAGVTVAGTAGADMFVGSAFDDTFTGIGNGDAVFGGAGSDTVVFAGNAARQIDLQNPGAFGTPSVTLESIENVTLGNGADSVLGNAAANVLIGGGGNDYLGGRDGADVLSGGIGDDTLDGGAGDDHLDGGDGKDLLRGGQGNDLMFGAEGDDTLFGNAGADTLDGGEGADVLNGGEGDDLIYGGGGKDTIIATSGADSVFGGGGNDLIFVQGDSGALIDGGFGNDTLSYSRSNIGADGIGVYVDLSGTTEALATQFGFQLDDITLSRISNINGSRGSDFLAGDGSANRLHGGAGDDVLMGRGGNDTLIGGAGNDSFVFRDAAGNNRIRDFTVGSDRILLAVDGFGDIDAGNIAARFVANAAPNPAANGNAQIVFDNAGAGAGRLFFDADGNGAGAAVLIATLQFATPGGLASFSAADIDFF